MYLASRNKDIFLEEGYANIEYDKTSREVPAG